MRKQLQKPLFNQFAQESLTERTRVEGLPLATGLIYVQNRNFFPFFSIQKDRNASVKDGKIFNTVSPCAFKR